MNIGRYGRDKGRVEEAFSCALLKLQVCIRVESFLLRDRGIWRVREVWDCRGSISGEFGAERPSRAESRTFSGG